MKIMMFIVCFVAIGFLLVAFKIIFKRKMHIWLPEFLKEEFKKIFVFENRDDHLSHVLFCFVDHFEPGWNKADIELERERVDGWYKKYSEFADNFKDSDGFTPRHTWFYPPHYYRDEHIIKIVDLCKRGYGEIEMHLHHNRMEPFPDTSNTLREKIENCIKIYSKHGIFRTTVGGEKKIAFAFIHGDWALDNSRDGYCGVNDEISILKEKGCYADFTFPSYMIESQPSIVNSIYYAKDDPNKPKSHDRGELVRVGGEVYGDLMMVQGPLGLRWKGRKRMLFPSVDDGEISKNNPPSKERIDYWVRRGVHVRGRKDWIMVKVFTHGAALSEQSVLLGEKIREMHSHLRKKYNNGENYRLHYVSAREMYNIIKAAEDGKKGDPGKYRDYIIDKYDYLFD